MTYSDMDGNMGAGMGAGMGDTTTTNRGGFATAEEKARDRDRLYAVPANPYNGAPLVPTGDAMRDGIGPAAWADRLDVPDRTIEGIVKIVPMRTDLTFSIAKGDPDPRGLPVEAADRRIAGTVVDVWVDRGEPQVRYYEVELAAGAAAMETSGGMSTGGGMRTATTVLLPAGYVQFPNFGWWGVDRLLVKSITAAQFAGVPQTRLPDVITFLEEDKIMAYFAGGHLYANAARSEPII